MPQSLLYVSSQKVQDKAEDTPRMSRMSKADWQSSWPCPCCRQVLCKSSVSYGGGCYLGGSRECWDVQPLSKLDELCFPARWFLALYPYLPGQLDLL